MKPQDRIARLSIAELARLHEEARHRADTLRDEAIDEVWRGIHAALSAGLSSAGRAASRLTQRLQHHRQLRGA